LYLRVVDGRFKAALPVLLGEETTGRSPTTITDDDHAPDGGLGMEYAAWRRRSLAEIDMCGSTACTSACASWRIGSALVMIGVRADGTEELVAVEDGYCESTDSWATVLRDLKRPGLRAPVVALGDSALGFWTAVGHVWSETREQRCWV
jgi:hypothetical protein